MALADPSKLCDKREGNGKTGAIANLSSNFYIITPDPVRPTNSARNKFQLLVIGQLRNRPPSLLAVEIDDQTRPLRRYLYQTRLPIHTIAGVPLLHVRLHRSREINTEIRSIYGILFCILQTSIYVLDATASCVKTYTHCCHLAPL